MALHVQVVVLIIIWMEFVNNAVSVSLYLTTLAPIVNPLVFHVLQLLLIV